MNFIEAITKFPDAITCIIFLEIPAQVFCSPCIQKGFTFKLTWTETELFTSLKCKLGVVFATPTLTLLQSLCYFPYLIKNRSVTNVTSLKSKIFSIPQLSEHYCKTKHKL